MLQIPLKFVVVLDLAFKLNQLQKVGNNNKGWTESQNRNAWQKEFIDVDYALKCWSM